MFRFLVLFPSLMILLIGLELSPFAQELFVMPWTTFLASLSAALVQWFDPAVLSIRNELRDLDSGFAVAILPGCNGVEASAILLAGMLAFPASWKMRLIGVAAGVLAVQLVNLVRIISLFYIGQWSLEWFNIAHHLIWQALIMFDVVVVWLLWVRAVGKASVMRGA